MRTIHWNDVSVVGALFALGRYCGEKSPVYHDRASRAYFTLTSEATGRALGHRNASGPNATPAPRYAPTADEPGPAGAAPRGAPESRPGTEVASKVLVERWMSEDEWARLCKEGTIVRLDESVAVNEPVALVYFSKMMLWAARIHVDHLISCGSLNWLEMTSYWIGWGAPEQVIDALDHLGETLLGLAHDRLARYLADSGDPTALKEAEDLAKFARTAARTPELRIHVHSCLGLARAHSGKPAALRCMYDTIVKYEFPGWTWKTFKKQLRYLSDTLLLRPRWRSGTLELPSTGAGRGRGDDRPVTAGTRGDSRLDAAQPAKVPLHEQLAAEFEREWRRWSIAAHARRGGEPTNEEIKEAIGLAKHFGDFGRRYSRADLTVAAKAVVQKWREPKYREAADVAVKSDDDLLWLPCQEPIVYMYPEIVLPPEQHRAEYGVVFHFRHDGFWKKLKAWHGSGSLAFEDLGPLGKALITFVPSAPDPSRAMAVV